MSKQTRKEKREEEARILAEMDAAMAEQGLPLLTKPPKQEEKYAREYDSTMPKKIHCRRCKTLMEKGVCPLCGYKLYVPMNKEKQRKIKWIATGILLAVFAAILVITKTM